MIPAIPTVDFRGERRSNATHVSTTDPDAQLYKKADGQKSVMAYLGHVLMDNRHGLIVNACATAATGTAEREAALLMLTAGRRPRTIGGDKNYDVASFVTQVRAVGVTPHVAQKAQYTAIDRRTTRHPGYHRESAQTEAGRASLWLDEDRRAHAQAPASRRGARRLDVYLRRDRLQPGAVTHPRGHLLMTMRVTPHRARTRPKPKA